MDCDSDPQTKPSPVSVFKSNHAPSGFGKASHSTKDLEAEQAAIDAMTDEEYMKYKKSLADKEAITPHFTKPRPSSSHNSASKLPETTGFTKATAGGSVFGSSTKQSNSLRSQWTRKKPKIDQKKLRQLLGGGVVESTSDKMAALDQALGAGGHSRSPRRTAMASIATTMDSKPHHSAKLDLDRRSNRDRKAMDSNLLRSKHPLPPPPHHQQLPYSKRRVLRNHILVMVPKRRPIPHSEAPMVPQMDSKVQTLRNQRIQRIECFRTRSRFGKHRNMTPRN